MRIELRVIEPPERDSRYVMLRRHDEESKGDARILHSATKDMDNRM